MKIAVFDADHRMRLVAERLKKRGQVYLIDEDDSVCRLKRIADTFDVVILPYWGIEETGFVKMRTKYMFAAEILESLHDQCVIFSGKCCQFFSHLNCRIKCWDNDEALLIQNAALTAEGMLCRLIETTERSLFTYHVDIIGSGRCAQALGKLLASLNIPYRFVSSSAGVNLKHENWIDLREWQRETPAELVVNTAPACSMNQQVLKNWKQVIQVYDLSSGCLGVDMKCRKHPFLKLYEEKALPSIFSVESAAELILGFIERELDT